MSQVRIRKAAATGFALALPALLASTACQRPSLDTRDGKQPECRVGVVMPTTGEMAPYGTEGAIAARLAFQEAERLARFSRPKIDIQDSASRVDQSNAAASALVAPPTSASILVGEINSDNTAALAGPAEIGAVPVIAPTASRISLTQVSKRLFRIWPSDAYEARAMSDFLRARGVKRIAVLYIQVQYGEEMANSFRDAFAGTGGEVQLEGYRPGTADFKPLLRRVGGFDAIYLISYVEDAALILRQGHDMNVSRGRAVQFFGTTVLDSGRLADRAGEPANGVIFAVVQPDRGGDQTARADFISRYEAARGASSLTPGLAAAAKTPTFAAYYVYDATALAFAACELVAKNGSPTGDRIISHLQAMPPYQGLTGLIAFDRNRDLAADRSIVFKTVKDGKIIELPR